VLAALFAACAIFLVNSITRYGCIGQPERETIDRRLPYPIVERACLECL